MKKLYTITLMACLIFCMVSMCSAEECTTNDGYFFTTTEENLDTAIELGIAKDYDAIELMYQRDELGFLREGVKVYAVERSLGKVKIRLKGDTITAWTVSEGLTCE